MTDNLARIRGRIADAAQRSGRSAADVRLVAVTKYVDLPQIRELLAAGCRELGESRPQSLWRRAETGAEPSSEPALQPPGGQPLVWHLIGHLQRNKLRRTLPLVGWIQSVDSLRLLTAIQEEAGLLSEAGALAHLPRLLLEVNVSREPAKHGFLAEDLLRNAPQLAAAGVPLSGLMGMAGLYSSPDQARREFAELRKLRDRLQQELGDAHRLSELSMGMSGDFEAAIMEGATIVRIGSALFE